MQRNRLYVILLIIFLIFGLTCLIIGTVTANVVLILPTLILLLLAGGFLASIRDDWGQAAEWNDIPNGTYELVSNVVDRVYVLKHIDGKTEVKYFTVVFMPNPNFPIGSIIRKAGGAVVLIK